MTNATLADCTKCVKNTYVAPLHDDRGGPLMCPICAGKWHAEHSRRRKWGRIAIKAMKMFLKEGGKYSDLDKLKFATSDFFKFDPLKYGGTDTIGSEVPDITVELLAEMIQLTHPDKHPPERRELAKRVTQQLVDLKPFVFPEPKPEPVKPHKPRDNSFKCHNENLKEPLQPSYPCEACSDTVPYYYCDSCKAEWQARRDKEREQDRAKQRRWYRNRRNRNRRWRGPAKCAECETEFCPLRKDTKYCSPACRQRAHRKRQSVTDRTTPAGGQLNTHNAEARP